MSFKVTARGAGASRIASHIRDGNPFFTISAQRGELSGHKNHERTKQLIADLHKLPISYVHVTGNFEETREDGSKKVVTEHSFLVMPSKKGAKTNIDNLQKIGLGLCRKYKQESIGFGDGHKIYFMDQQGKKSEADNAVTFNDNKIKDLPGFSKIGAHKFSFTTHSPDFEADPKDDVNYNVEHLWWNKLSKDEQEEYIKNHPGTNLKIATKAGVRLGVLAEPKPNETYTLGSNTFDVFQAHMLIKTGAILPERRYLPLKPYMQAVNANVDPAKDYAAQAPDDNINWEHVAKLTDTDLEIPGIVVSAKYGSLLIDGNHRMLRLAMMGKSSMPVYVIAAAHISMITPGTSQYVEAAKELQSSSLMRVHAAVQGDPEKTMTIGKLTFDQAKGIGQVPDNQQINYLGLAVIMTPKQFQALAAPRNFDDETSLLKGIIAAIKQGRPIGSPFLDVSINNPDKPQVMGHEGRTRAQAIADVYGQVPMLVHIFLRGGGRARHLTIEKINAMYKGIVPEKQKAVHAGPNFGRRIWWMGKWQDVPEKLSTTEAAMYRLLTVAGNTADINARYKRDLLNRIRDSLCDLEFFSTDLRYIEKFEGLLREIDSRQVVEPQVNVIPKVIDPAATSPAPPMSGVTSPYSNE